MSQIITRRRALSDGGAAGLTLAAGGLLLDAGRLGAGPVGASSVGFGSPGLRGPGAGVGARCALLGHEPAEPAEPAARDFDRGWPDVGIRLCATRR